MNLNAAAQYFANMGLEYDDCHQEAHLGYLEGKARYEEGHGAALDTYCYTYVRSRLLRMLKKRPTELRYGDEIEGFSQYDPIVESIDYMRATQKLSEAIFTLPLRERWVIEEKYLREADYGFYTIAAKRLNISVERVRQLEKQALGGLKKYFENNSKNTGQTL